MQEGEGPVKALSEKTPIRMTLGFVLVALGGFASFLWLKWQAEASAKDIVEIKESRTAEAKANLDIFQKIQMDLAVIKTKVEFIEKNVQPKKR